MENLMGLLDAYEHASFVGLPAVEMHTNKERAKKILTVLSDHFEKENELSSLSSTFINILTYEQEDLFEEVERYRVQASNRYERSDFLRITSSSSSSSSTNNNNNTTVLARMMKVKKGKYQKFPKATKNMLKDWLFDNQDNPYPNDEEKAYLCEITGVSLAQINQWFINGRRRILNMGNDERKSIRGKRGRKAASSKDSSNFSNFSNNGNDEDAEMSQGDESRMMKRIKSEEEEEESGFTESVFESKSNTTCPMPPPMPYPSELSVSSFPFPPSSHSLPLPNYFSLDSFPPLSSSSSIFPPLHSSLHHPPPLMPMPNLQMRKPATPATYEAQKRKVKVPKVEEPVEEFALRRSKRIQNLKM